MLSIKCNIRIFLHDNLFNSCVKIIQEKKIIVNHKISILWHTNYICNVKIINIYHLMQYFYSGSSCFFTYSYNHMLIYNKIYVFYGFHKFMENFFRWFMNINVIIRKSFSNLANQHSISQPKNYKNCKWIFFCLT